jgi:hypothetical protein
MAVDINSVYQKVLVLANKEQRGYITPQEFNLLANKAQLELYENYFHGIKMSEVKPKNQMNYADHVEMIEAKLHPFHVDTTVSASLGSLTLPTDIYKLIDITRGGKKVTQVNKSEIAYTENHPLTKASTSRSVFVREDSGIITIYPTTSLVGEDFEVSYYKKPADPNWTYVVLNDKALYNANASDLQSFELHASEEENLVARILIYIGISIKQPELQSAGAGNIQLNKQEQNS